MFRFAAPFVSLGLFAFLLLLALPLLACDKQGTVVTPPTPPPPSSDPGDPGLVVRLAVEPEVVWLPAVGETASVVVYERLASGVRRLADKVSLASLDGGVASVDAAGRVTAHAIGDTRLLVQAAGHTVEVPVRVRPDLLATIGFASTTAPVALWHHDSTALASYPTGVALGAADSFYGGVAHLTIHGDYAYAIGSFPAPQYDTVYRLDPATGAVLATMPIVEPALNVASQDASAAILAFHSASKAYIAHRYPDALGDYTVTVFNPSTMTITGRIVVPPVAGTTPFFADMLSVGPLMLLLDNAFDVNTLHFGTARIYAIDTTTDILYDLDPSSPGTLDTVALTGANPRLTRAPGGELYAVCMGDGFFGVGMVIDVLDPATLAIMKTLTFDPSVAGGPHAWDSTGRLYIGSSYAPTLVSVDGHNHTILRDAGNEIVLPGPTYVSGLVITHDDRLVMGNPNFLSGHELRAFDTADDTNTNQPPFLTATVPDAPGNLVPLPRLPEPVFAQHVLDAQNLVVAGDAELALGAPTAVAGGVPSAAAVLDDDGALVLSFGGRWIVDRPGADFVVFGHATLASGAPGLPHLWREMQPGRVEVSQDGVNWVAFPASEDTGKSANDATRYTSGWFGITPTWRTPEMSVSAATAGGDRFDLATVGLGWARFVRLTGSGAVVDAVAALHHAMD